MDSHQLAIAKASLAAALLRPDPESVGRDEVARFHSLLDGTVARCSPSNVQTCKTWLLENVVPSAARITAIAKYLLALSGSFSTGAPVNGASNGTSHTTSRPSAKRKRLHLLYLLNDLLHHTKYHGSASSRHASVASNLQPQLVALFTSVASFDSSQHPKHHEKLYDLIDLWELHAFHSRIFLGSLRQAVKTASQTSSDASQSASGITTAGNQPATAVTTRQAGRDAPFSMPATHGDPSTPYYDLPAGNMIPHIIPNSTIPINPELVKPLQFVAGPADESLATVVRDFLKDVDTIYTTANSVEVGEAVPDLDEMGQAVLEDAFDGKLGAKESYYGWSIAFCEKMKKRKRGHGVSNSSDRAGGVKSMRSRSNSRSRSSSSSPRNRARYSSSPRSHSRSRSGHRRSRYQDSPRSTRSSPRARSVAEDRQQRPSRSPDREANRRQPPARPPSNQAFVTPIDQIDNPFGTFMPPPPPAPAAPNASSFQHNFPIGPNGLPVPPPPPFHQGPWPPPPPNLPSGVQFNPGQFPNFSSTEFLQGNFAPPPLPGGWPGSPQNLGRGHVHGAHSHLPPPPSELGPGWQEQQGSHGWQGRQWSPNNTRGRGSSGQNQSPARDPRKR